MTEQNKNARQDDEREDDGTNRSDGEGTPIYLTGNSTLQSPEEHAHDKSVDPQQNTLREASGDDLHEIKAGRLTGRDPGAADNNNNP
jgi:hypothetical protein